jgi:hypothetical protein
MMSVMTEKQKASLQKKASSPTVPAPKRSGTKKTKKSKKGAITA